MNVRVNLTKRVNTSEGLRYCPAIVAANGRIKPDWVFVDGKDVRHPEGALLTITTLDTVEDDRNDSVDEILR